MTPEQQKFVDDVTSAGFHSMRLSDAQKKVAAKLAPLFAALEAGQAMHDLVESTVAHVSHGGPTREDAEKCLETYRAALAHLQKEKG